MPYLDPIAAICRGLIPTAPPEDVVDAVVVEHIIWYANSNTEAEFGGIDEVRRLRDDNCRSTYVDVERNAPGLCHRCCLE